MTRFIKFNSIQFIYPTGLYLVDRWENSICQILIWRFFIYNRLLILQCRGLGGPVPTHHFLSKKFLLLIWSCMSTKRTSLFDYFSPKETIQMNLSKEVDYDHIIDSLIAKDSNRRIILSWWNNKFFAHRSYAHPMHPSIFSWLRHWHEIMWITVVMPYSDCVWGT